MEGKTTAEVSCYKNSTHNENSDQNFADTVSLVLETKTDDCRILQEAAHILSCRGWWIMAFLNLFLNSKTDDHCLIQKCEQKSEHMSSWLQLTFCKTTMFLKLQQNKKPRIFVWNTHKKVSFSQLRAVKRHYFWCIPKQIFGPSYFVEALVGQ